MARSLHQRMSFYVWSLIGCPLIGWSAAIFGTHGEGGVAKFVFLFIALPALLALVGARLLDRRVGDAVLGTVAAGALGALTQFLTILWLASQGVFEQPGGFVHDGSICDSRWRVSARSRQASTRATASSEIAASGLPELAVVRRIAQRFGHDVQSLDESQTDPRRIRPA